MKSIRILVAAMILMAGFAGQAHAQLVGFVGSFPTTTFGNGTYLFYDHDAINATTGLLRVVSGSLQLNEGPSAGNSTVGQTYLGGTDQVPDLMFSIQVRNGTGGFAAGSFVSGVVGIGFGINAGVGARWDWDGTVKALGSQSGTGTIIDAIWTMTGDQYQNMPANMSQFTNGWLTGNTGVITINSSAAWGGPTANFSNDWVYGSNPAANVNLNSYRLGMTSPNEVNSTVLVTVAIPEPEVALLMFIGLPLLGLLAWVRNKQE